MTDRFIHIKLITDSVVFCNHLFRCRYKIAAMFKPERRDNRMIFHRRIGNRFFDRKFCNFAVFVRPNPSVCIRIGQYSFLMPVSKDNDVACFCQFPKSVFIKNHSIITARNQQRLLIQDAFSGKQTGTCLSLRQTL